MTDWPQLENIKALNHNRCCCCCWPAKKINRQSGCACAISKLKSMRSVRWRAQNERKSRILCNRLKWMINNKCERIKAQHTKINYKQTAADVVWSLRATFYLVVFFFFFDLLFAKVHTGAGVNVRPKLSFDLESIFFSLSVSVMQQMC